MNRPQWCRSIAALWLLLGWAASGAFAACGIAGGGASIDFGPYHPLSLPGRLASADVDSTGSVTVSCSGLTQGVNYTLKLDGGRSNSISARRMGGTGGGSDMAYNLYTNATRSLVWGDGSSGSALSGSLGAGTNSHTHTFYGRIPGGQNSVIPGGFSDLLVITLEYSP
jgi:spore coat protein U-like protein